MDKLQDLNTQRRVKAKQFNDTPTSSWRKELFKLELAILDGKLALEQWKLKNR